MKCLSCGGWVPANAEVCACGARVASPDRGPPALTGTPSPPHASSVQQTTALAPEVRREILRQHIAYAAQYYGARLETQYDYTAHLVQGNKVNHILHFLIGAITCGLWWAVWLILSVNGGEKRTIIFIDERGEPLYTGVIPRPPLQRDVNPTLGW